MKNPVYFGGRGLSVCSERGCSCFGSCMVGEDYYCGSHAKEHSKGGLVFIREKIVRLKSWL